MTLRAWIGSGGFSYIDHLIICTMYSAVRISSVKFDPISFALKEVKFSASRILGRFINDDDDENLATSVQEFVLKKSNRTMHRDLIREIDLITPHLLPILGLADPIAPRGHRTMRKSWIDLSEKVTDRHPWLPDPEGVRLWLPEAHQKVWLCGLEFKSEYEFRVSFCLDAIKEKEMVEIKTPWLFTNDEESYPQIEVLAEQLQEVRMELTEYINGKKFAGVEAVQLALWNDGNTFVTLKGGRKAG